MADAISVPTSPEIRARLSEVDAALAEHTAEADRLALDAITGNADARRRLTETHNLMAAAARDRDTLARALGQVEAAEAAQDIKAAEARRARHIDAARRHALDLQDAAVAVDGLLSALRGRLSDLTRLETSLRLELAAAKALPEIGVVGQQGIGNMALDKLAAITKGGAHLVDQRGLAYWVSNGWSSLLKSKDDI